MLKGMLSQKWWNSKISFEFHYSDSWSPKSPATRLFVQQFVQLTSNKTSKPVLRNPPMTDGFPSQRASNAESFSRTWRHHAVEYIVYYIVYLGSLTFEVQANVIYSVEHIFFFMGPVCNQVTGGEGLLYESVLARWELILPPRGHVA